MYSTGSSNGCYMPIVLSKSPSWSILHVFQLMRMGQLRTMLLPFLRVNCSEFAVTSSSRTKMVLADFLIYRLENTFQTESRILFKPNTEIFFGPLSYRNSDNLLRISKSTRHPSRQDFFEFHGRCREQIWSCWSPVASLRHSAGLFLVMLAFPLAWNFPKGEKDWSTGSSLFW